MRQGAQRAGWSDLVLPAILAVLAVVETTRLAPLSDRPGPPLVIAGAMATALVWRRTRPFFVAGVVAACFAVYPLLERDPGESLVQAVALLVAAYALASFGELRPAVAGLLLLTAAGVVRSWQMDYDGGSIVVNALWGIVAWVLGRAVHTRDRRARMAQLAVTETERLRETGEREAAEAERARIARELHDVVAHAVTVIVVQARGARRWVDRDSGEVRQALDAIEEMGREAIDELRRMLALLDDPDDGEDVRSGPAELKALVDRVRTVGLPVTLDIDGSPSHRNTSVDVSAYRVVQEALTNALRYGDAAPAHVAVAYRPDCIDVRVDSALGSDNFTGTGRGLAGLRERVRLTGGTLEVGSGERGRYVVHAILPLEGAPS